MGRKNTHKIWVAKHREELIKCAVPMAIFENQIAWKFFLEDGPFSATSDVPYNLDVEVLSHKDASNLVRLLASLYPERYESGISQNRAINRIEYILHQGPHAPDL